MQKYTKLPLDHAQLVALLKSRGLQIQDEGYAEKWLGVAGYYRFTGYGLHFRQKDKDGYLLESYLSGTTFESVVALYEFDRHLRLLVMDAIERFEVAFRVRFNNVMALWYNDSHWFLKPALFSTKLNKEGELLFDPGEFSETAIKHSKSLSIKHYNQKYGDPCEPPCWMIAEESTFGLYSRAYGMLENNQNQKSVADSFYLSVKDLKSFAQGINDLRNKCAHHARLWDARFLNGPRISGKLKGISDGNQQLYTTIAALLYCLWSIDPETRWLERLDKLILDTPAVRLDIMGFPSDWKKKLIELYPAELKQEYPHLHSTTPMTGSTPNS